MKVKSEHVFMPDNLDHWDITISMLYRKTTVYQFIRVKMTKQGLIRSTIFANKTIQDFLRKV